MSFCGHVDTVTCPSCRPAVYAPTVPVDTFDTFRAPRVRPPRTDRPRSTEPTMVEVTLLDLLARIDAALAIEPEDHATKSRDYGRGFAEAIRQVRAALANRPSTSPLVDNSTADNDPSRTLADDVRDGLHDQPHP